MKVGVKAEGTRTSGERLKAECRRLGAARGVVCAGQRR
jgi:hypothetical protein